jgi:conjugal transfer mating pair stabilization protein TraN
LLSDPSPSGNAYRTLRTTVDRSRPDMRRDPLWSQTDDVVARFADIAKTFADCSVATSFTNTTRAAHVPDNRTCDRLEDRGGACSVLHDYSILSLVSVWGGATLQSCGSGCTQVVYRHGDTGHENMGRNYPAYLAAQTFGYAVSDSSRVSAASVSIQASGTPSLGFQIDQYTERYAVAFDGYAYADASTGSFDYVNRPAIDMDWTGSLRDGASFSIGNDYAFRVTASRQWWRASRAYTVTVTLRHTPLVQDRGWTPSAPCAAMANALAANGGFCQGSIACRGAPPLDGNGCYSGNGVSVCPGDMQASPIAGQSPFCTQIDVTADCSGFNSTLSD